MKSIELNRNSFDGILKITKGLEKEEIMWKEGRNNITFVDTYRI